MNKNNRKGVTRRDRRLAKASGYKRQGRVNNTKKGHGAGTAGNGIPEGKVRPARGRSLIGGKPRIMLTEKDHQKLEKLLQGALKTTIKAHGPVTSELVGSVTKRVMSQIGVVDKGHTELTQKLDINLK